MKSDETTKVSEKMVEKHEGQRKLKILIVEDQFWPQLALLEALKKQFGDMVEDFREGGDVSIVTNHQDVLKILEESVFDYQIVVLDHRILEKPLKRTMEKKASKELFPSELLDKNGTPAFTLYEDDEDFRSAKKVEVGYTLTDRFKKKGAVVIGTSSLSKQELGGISLPDYQISKVEEPDKALGKIKNHVLEEI